MSNDNIEATDAEVDAIGEILYAAGWRDRADALGDGLRAAIPKLREALVKHGAAPVPAQVPDDVMRALDRMCTPLDDSLLGSKTATTQQDARCMGVIRRYILRTAVKESLTAGDKRDIPEGWVFYSADASVADCVSVILVRDEAGRNWWLSLSEYDKERIDMYATGKGKTLQAAIADASNNAMRAAAQKGEKNGHL